MTRTGTKQPFPMPRTGMVSDEHPFGIGVGSLALSQNWFNEDGIFRTRDGIAPVDPDRRWYEKLEIAPNLVPHGLAEGSAAGLAMLTFDASVDVQVATEDSIVGDHQYIVTPLSSPVSDIVTDQIEVDPGRTYTSWIFTSEVAPGLAMEFVNSEGTVLESHELAGDLMDEGIYIATAFSPQTTAAVQFRITPSETEEVKFGPLKLIEGEEVVAWSFGDGYGGTPDQNIFPMETAHPESGVEASEMWEPLVGTESIYSYNGSGSFGLFDGYTNMAIAGRALAYATQPTKILPAVDETTGLELKEDYRVEVDRSVVHKMSVSYFFDTEHGFIADMVFRILGLYYNADGDEIGYVELVKDYTYNIPFTEEIALFGDPRGRAEATFQPPFGTTHMGIRLECTCPTGEREIVRDNNYEAVYDNAGNLVYVEEENYVARRLGIILEDVKLVESPGSDARWWDFVIPIVEHDGPFGANEIPLAYYPHDYLYEGTTEPNKIVLATDHSLWKWNDTTDKWEQVGFDLGTIYSAFYLTGEDEDGEETLTLDERILFEETSDEGYTADTGAGEPDLLEIEVRLPAALEGATSPSPAEYWQYRVNEGDWSDTFPIDDEEDPILEAPIEIDFGTPRTIPVKIKLDVTGPDDFEDICVRPEDTDAEDFPDPVFKATLFTRQDDSEAGETLFHADREHPVDLRGYDFAQKTYTICANLNDRVTAWDGQLDTKAERAGNAPYAKTICISGGRVLAGNVRFDDPGQDFVAPLGVVFTDTFLSRGFRNWHPELTIRLADTPGEVVKLLELGNLAVGAYKTDAVYMLVFQTGNNPFRAQLMASNVAGPIGVRSVVALTENSHFYLGSDGGVYMFDGSYPRNFSPTISRTIQSELDLNFKERAFLSYSPRLNAVFAMYPTKGSDGRVNRGMWIDLPRGAGWPFEWDGDWFDFSAGAPVQTISNYEMGGVTMRFGNVTSALATGQALQPDFFLGAADGTTFVMDRDLADDWGEKVKAIFRSGLSEFGLRDRYSVLKEIEFMFNRTNKPHEAKVEVWAADHGIDARPVSHETINLFEEGPYFAEVREKARFWGYGVEIDAAEQILLSGAFGAFKALGFRKS